ncbi:MAG: hypothetical protein KDA33_01840 [Phycisphaerales bacterium]|nr:hypothetical protein [Phycisphaerales bacterium]
MPLQRNTKTTIVAALCLLMAGAGCLKRREMIEVRPDGGAAMVLEFEGSQEDLAGPTALPTAADGWRVSQSKGKRANEDVHIYTASADFAPGAALPSGYGDAGGVHLTFPTEIHREERPDGVYLRFRRIYEPRPYARTQYWNDRYIDDDIRKISEKPIDGLNQDERTKLLHAFANVQSHQQLEALAMAVSAATPDVPIESRLAARARLLDVYERFDYAGLADSIKGLSEEEANAKIVQIGEAIPKDADQAYIDTLATMAKLDAHQLAALRASLEQERLRRRITDASRSQTFQIELTMPGEIVATNADQVEDGGLKWEFDGRAFCDRPYELVAISKLSAAPAQADDTNKAESR